MIIMMVFHLEALWSEYKRVKSMDDQMKVNYCLRNMNIKWKHTKCDNRLNDTFEGSANNDLAISVLPQKYACRGIGCESSIRAQCYIWHKGRNKHKFNEMKSKAVTDKIWFLRSDWATVQNSTADTGLEWLESVSVIS